MRGYGMKRTPISKKKGRKCSKYTNHINFYSKSVRIGDFILSRSVRLYKRGLVSYFVGSIWRSPSGFSLIKLENHMQQVLHEFRSL